MFFSFIFYIFATNNFFMEIKFNEQMAIKSQRTIASVLRNVKYTFLPISKYDNNFFYCIIHCEEKESPLFQWLRKYAKWIAPKMKNEYVDYRLKLSFRNCDDLYVDEPMVFSRQEVKNIVADVPENYIGEEVL